MHSQQMYMLNKNIPDVQESEVKLFIYSTKKCMWYLMEAKVWSACKSITYHWSRAHASTELLLSIHQLWTVICFLKQSHVAIQKNLYILDVKTAYFLRNLIFCVISVIYEILYTRKFLWIRCTVCVEIFVAH